MGKETDLPRRHGGRGEEPGIDQFTTEDTGRTERRALPRDESLGFVAPEVQEKCRPEIAGAR
jgi:hypothetical protein